MPEAICEEKPKAESTERSDRQAPLRVCFVCTGNTCRSPMAQAVTNALAERELAPIPPSVRACATRRLEACSAGLYASSGDPITAHAVKALEAAEVEAVEGHDYHLHTAHTVTAGDVETADILVGMSASHVMELLLRFPEAASKLRCMPSPISDPYGGDLACYQACLAQIEEGVKALFFSGAPT